jgi:hypothetical protein
MSTHKVQVRRVSEAPARGDGHRVLVDRIWPHGMSDRESRPGRVVLTGRGSGFLPHLRRSNSG